MPESLLGPLLDAAADTLGGLDEDEVPAPLQRLVRFERRGLHRGAARQQIARALEHDDAFRAHVFESFLTRPEVRVLLDGWSADSLLVSIDDLAERGDLPLLASSLLAGQPEGWPFALGVVVGVADRLRRATEQAADAEALRTRIANLEEGLRRAESTAAEADDARSRAEAELRDERRSRRDREEAAGREAAEAARAARTAESRIAQAQRERDRLEERASREGERAREMEAEAHELRARVATLGAELAAARARADEAPVGGTGLRSADLRALADAAELARRLADGLAGVVSEARRRGALDDVRREPAAEPPRRAGAPTRRPEVPLPPGMVADSPDAVRAMARADEVVVIVDGYNVSKRAWPDATPGEQRDRLVAMLGELHARSGASVTVVFDGDDVHAPPPRRAGVRVRFSSADREADDVVVEEVANLPRRIPALVVSSDTWVREHATAEGARVVSADALLSAVRV